MNEDEERARQEAKNQLEKAEKELEQAGKLFNPKELATRNKQLFEKVHPVFGKISYGKITMEELDALNAELETLGKKDDKTLKTEMMLWKMLQKGCPELTLDDVRSYGFDEVSELVTFLVSDGFFQNPKLQTS